MIFFHNKQYAVFFFKCPNPFLLFKEAFDQDYKVVTLKGTSFVDTLKNSAPGSGLHDLYHHGGVSLVDSVDEVYQGMQQDKKTLFFGSAFELFGFPRIENLMLRDRLHSNMAFGFRKGRGADF